MWDKNPKKIMKKLKYFLFFFFVFLHSELRVVFADIKDKFMCDHWNHFICARVTESPSIWAYVIVWACFNSFLPILDSRFLSTRAHPRKVSKKSPKLVGILAKSRDFIDISAISQQFKEGRKRSVQGVCKNQNFSKSVKMCTISPKLS